MTLLKTALFTLMLTTAGIAQAELTANVPLDTSRYELMGVSDLVNHASQGNDHAQFYLAKRYQKGYGVIKDAKEAIKWYKKAANQNVTPAQLNLGIMYARGEVEGITKQEAEKQARYWLERAAKRGDNRASYTLALIDEQQEKLVDAYKWYELSTFDVMLNDDVRNKARGKINKLALALNFSDSDANAVRDQAYAWFQE